MLNKQQVYLYKKDVRNIPHTFIFRLGAMKVGGGGIGRV